MVSNKCSSSSNTSNNLICLSLLRIKLEGFQDWSSRIHQSSQEWIKIEKILRFLSKSSHLNNSTLSTNLLFNNKITLTSRNQLLNTTSRIRSNPKHKSRVFNINLRLSNLSISNSRHPLLKWRINLPLSCSLRPQSNHLPKFMNSRSNNINNSTKK